MYKLPFDGMNGFGMTFWKGAACLRSYTSSRDCENCSNSCSNSCRNCGSCRIVVVAVVVVLL